MSLFGTFKNEPFDFPLKKCNVSVHSVDGMALVSIHQTYYNSLKEGINSYYRFPLYRNGTVNDFAVHFSGGVIRCDIQKVEEAKKTYTEAVEKGKQAALMTEKNAEDYDVSIGNIHPEETVVVHIKYIVHLERDIETKGRKFVLPTTITPRYDNMKKNTPVLPWDAPALKNPPSLYNRSSAKDTVGEIGFSVEKKPDDSGHLEDRSHLKEDDDAITYNTNAQNISVNFKMDVVETNSILGLEPSKFNGTILRKSRVTDNRFVLEVDDISMEQDFVVSILVEDDKPTQFVAWAERFHQETDDGEDGCTVKVILPESEVFKVSDKKIEFIFLIDRSGSMMGNQINNAKRALTLLLNSLPVDCYFNVYGFGSSWKRFYDKSAKYGKEVFHESKQLVERIQADMGGTELNGVLEAIYRTEKIPGYMRRIILLTDGEIWDLSSVFRIADGDPDVPIFTIGVGNAVSHELVQGLAERTNGFCETIMDADLIETKVLQQLKRTFYDVTTMEIGNQKVNIRPGQEHVLCVFPVSEFSEQQEQNGDAYLNISFNTKDESNVIPVHWIVRDDEEGETGKDEVDFPLRLTWVDEQIRIMMRKLENLKEEAEAEANTIKNAIVSMSKKYKILTPYTSFVGVLEKKEEDTKAASTTIITPLHPGKYASSGVSGKYGTSSVMTGALVVSGGLGLSGGSLLGGSSYDASPLKRQMYQQGMQWNPPVSDARSGKDSRSFALNSVRSRVSNVNNNFIDLSDYDDGENGEEKDAALSSVSTPSLEPSPFFSFDGGISIFLKAIEFDGSISWKILQKHLSLPAVPSDLEEKDAEDSGDIWATLLFLAFVTLHDKQDSDEYRMMVEKSISWLAQHDIGLEWRERALQVLQNGNGSVMEHVFF